MATARTRLDRPTILAAADGILARDGLEGLTMRRLAATLGVAPMATYRHFSDRAALVDALIDEAAEGIAIPDPTGDGRLDLKALARSLRDALLARPALVPVVVARPALGPGAIRLAEAAYAVLVPTGFGPRTTDRAANLLFGYVLGFIALEAPRRFPAASASLYRTQAAVQAGYAAIDPASLPYTLIVSPDASRFVDDAQFEWGLHPVLDGIQARYPGD
jgi:TetR/AcrR family tetracycline transcriptional repressor